MVACSKTVCASEPNLFTRLGHNGTPTQVLLGPIARLLHFCLLSFASESVELLSVSGEHAPQDYPMHCTLGALSTK